DLVVFVCVSTWSAPIVRSRVRVEPADPTVPSVDDGPYLGVRPGSMGTAARAAPMKAATAARSFRPGADSTPLATSTIQGRTRTIRSDTFPGVRPPAKMRRGTDK